MNCLERLTVGPGMYTLYLCLFVDGGREYRLFYPVSPFLGSVISLDGLQEELGPLVTAYE